MTWAQIDRSFLELGLTPEMVDDMTLAEICVAQLDADPTKNNPVMSPEEIDAYMEWWLGLTPEEQLWAEA